MSKFLNIFDFADESYPFQIIIGARGYGKTYSAAEGVCGVSEKYTMQGKPLWMRRTRDEWEGLQDSQKGEGMNPFKPINMNYGTNIGMLPMGNGFGGIYERENRDDGLYNYLGAPIGYTTALSTVSHMRGIDLSDVSDWFYDEFIAEQHVKRMRGECDALLNAYETFNRNREFNGKPPIRLWMLANSNDIYNPIFEGLGIVNIAEKMIYNGEEHKYIKDRGLAIHILKSSDEFVSAKKETALYKLTQGTKFYDMALGNNFSYNDFSLIEYRSIKGYRPLCALSNCFFYKKKGDREIYVCYAPAQNVQVYNIDLPQDKMSFMRSWGIKIKPYYISGRLIFESYDIKRRILDVIL